MSLWRLEWLRLVRTRRLVALIGVYLFFGFTAAPMARYMREILGRFAGGVQIALPDPQPVDAVAGFVSNVGQIGLVVFVAVVTSAVAIDAHREMAVFLRTRSPFAAVLLPRFVVNAAAGASAFTLGMSATWYGTALLFGPLDLSAMVAGCVLEAMYLTCVAAVATAWASIVRSVLATVGLTLGTALVLGIVGSLGELGRWSPSTLLGSPTGLVAGATLESFAGPTVVVIVAVPLLLWFATSRGARREI